MAPPEEGRANQTFVTSLATRRGAATDDIEAVGGPSAPSKATNVNRMGDEPVTEAFDPQCRRLTIGWPWLSRSLKSHCSSDMSSAIWLS